MPGNDDVVLKLVIKGMDPAEVTRLAQETSGRLAQESAAHINRLTQLHKAAAEEQSAAMKKAVDQEIKESTRLLSAIQQIERQREIAANRASNAFRRTLEDLENLTIITQGAIGAWKSFAGTISSAADEMLKVSQVLNAPGGGEGAFAISALVGDVSAFDIARVRNKALQQDLTLSTQDFVKLTAAASELADQLGTNAKDALETFTDAMATGRTRALALIGINVDAEAVYKRLADSLGKTADQLTEVEKKMAMQKEIMDQVSAKAPEVGKGITTLGDALERSLTSATNAWHAFLTALANFKLPEVVKDLLDDSFSEEELKGLAPYSVTAKTRLDAIVAQRKAHLEATANSYLGGASEEDLIPTDETAQFFRKRFGSDVGRIKSKDISAQQRAAAEQQRKFSEQFDQMLAGGKQSPPGLDYSTDEDQILTLASGAIGSDSAEAFAKENEAKAQSYEKLQSLVRKEAQDTADAMGKTMEDVAKRRESVESRTGGLMYALMFGPDGPDKTYEEMDAFQQATVDMGGMVSETMKKMAEAVGQSLANWVADSQGAKKSFRDTTNELMVSLSAQAYTQSLMELAKAAASFAGHDYYDAEQHIGAAAAFALVGTAAGVTARAIGHSAPSTSSGSSRSGSGAARSYGSSSGGGSRSSDSGGGNITFNLTVMPGGEAEAGRQINKALDAYYAQTGRGAKAAA